MPAVVGSLLVQSANPLVGFRNARKPKLLGFVQFSLKTAPAAAAGQLISFETRDPLGLMLRILDHQTQ